MDHTPATLLHRLCDEPTARDWEHFVRLFTPLLRRWAARFNVDGAAAEDVLQEVFVLLIRELPNFKYDPTRSFRAWLWTVFRNAILAWRKRQWKAGSELDPDGIASPDLIAEATEAEYRQYLIGRIIQIVQADFPATTWRIFQQVAIEGRSGQEVADNCGVTVNAVYLARSRVLARLREELAGLSQ